MQREKRNTWKSSFIPLYWVFFWVTYNSRDLFFHNSSSQKSEISITGLKSRCWQGSHILQRLKRIYSNFFQFLVTTKFSWLVAISRQSLPPWSQCFLISVCLCIISLCFFLIRTLVINAIASVLIREKRNIQIFQDSLLISQSLLTQSYVQILFFQIRQHLQVLGISVCYLLVLFFSLTQSFSGPKDSHP